MRLAIPNEILSDYQAAFQAGGDFASYFKAHGLHEVKWNVIEQFYDQTTHLTRKAKEHLLVPWPFLLFAF